MTAREKRNFLKREIAPFPFKRSPFPQKKDLLEKNPSKEPPPPPTEKDSSPSIRIERPIPSSKYWKSFLLRRKTHPLFLQAGGRRYTSLQKEGRKSPPFFMSSGA